MISYFLVRPPFLKHVPWNAWLLIFVGFLDSGLTGGNHVSGFFLIPPTYLKNTICSEFRVLPTGNLGIYLGVPLVRGRMTRSSYQYLLDRVRQKLAGWKVATLSQAACTILISTTLLSLPQYVMQTAAIPKTIVQELERLCRQFFWGDLVGTRKLHTISWDKICLPRDQGGLGIPSLATVNLTLLAKLIWKLVQSPTNLSSCILTLKYGGWPTLVTGTPRPNSSHIWRGLVAATPLFQRGLQWQVANGSCTLFWEDRWLLQNPLHTLATREIPKNTAP